MRVGTNQRKCISVQQIFIRDASGLWHDCALGPVQDPVHARAKVLVGLIVSTLPSHQTTPMACPSKPHNTGKAIRGAAMRAYRRIQRPAPSRTRVPHMPCIYARRPVRPGGEPQLARCRCGSCTAPAPRPALPAAGMALILDSLIVELQCGAHSS